MTSEQLHAARAAHWRQNGSPVLTLDDAQAWLQANSVALFLPRKAQLPAPAPSFVEACLGQANATPPREAIEHAHALLVRLIDARTAVALNLFGTVGEQPDFMIHVDALTFAISLRGDRNWKAAPEKTAGHKVSPLVVELWKVLEAEGGLTAHELQERLGRELTEAAVLRGLGELWQALRVAPMLQPDARPALWELLSLHFRKAVTTGSTMSQVTALSVLVSLYLQSVHAATGEEIEIFLSPFASRSRVREAVRGLAATQQVHSLSMEAQTYYFLEGGLPEFPEQSAPAATEAPAATSERRVPRRAPLPAAPREAASEAGDSREENPRPSRPPFKRPAGPPPSLGPAWQRERPAAGRGGKRPEAGAEQRGGYRAQRPGAGAQGRPQRPPFARRENAPGEEKFSRPAGREQGGTRPPRRPEAGERRGFNGPRRERFGSERPRFERRSPDAGSDRPTADRRRFDQPASDRPRFNRPGRPPRDAAAAPYRGGDRRRSNEPGSRPPGSRPPGSRPPFASSRPERPDEAAGRSPDRPSRPYRPARPSRPDRPDSPAGSFGPNQFGPKQFGPKRFGPGDRSARSGERPFSKTGAQSGWRPRADAAPGDRPARPAGGDRPGVEDRPRRPFGPGAGQRNFRRDRPDASARGDRAADAAGERRFTPRPDNAPGGPPRPRFGKPGGFAKAGGRPSGGPTGGRPSGGPNARPGGKLGPRPGGKFGARPGGKPGEKFGPRPAGKTGPKSANRPGPKPGGRKFGGGGKTFRGRNAPGA